MGKETLGYISNWEKELDEINGTELIDFKPYLQFITDFIMKLIRLRKVKCQVEFQIMRKLHLLLETL